MTLAPRQVIQGRYRILSTVGGGSFGVVYKSWDINLNKHVAIKENLDASPEALRQFVREAQILSKLSHSNLPRVTDHFFIPGLGQYLVMDYIGGKDLQEILNDTGRSLPIADTLAWIDQVCDALIYLHEQYPPIIHRDIKPANIKITSEGRAVLVDFGISKIYDPALKTTLGARAVTPGYSAPEQYGRGTTDQRSDVYSLGATLYTLLTGQEPPESVQRIANNATLIPPCQLIPTLSPHISDAIMRASQIDTTQRFRSMREFRQALQGGTTPLSVRKPSLLRWWWLLIPVILIVMGVILLGRIKPPDSSIDGMTLLYVPAGEFVMGSNDGAENGRPEHSVYLDAFSIDRTEVTNAMFKKFVEATGYHTDAEKAGSSLIWELSSKTKLDVQGADWRHPHGPTTNLDGLDNHPVVQVSWNDARDYCAWAGRRLPTEAEWEKAARGSDKRAYPWGNQDVAGNLLNFADRSLKVGGADQTANDGYQYTAPAGHYPDGRSPYEVLDMAGNVWEWGADWYDEAYYGKSPNKNPTGPSTGELRVLRGGGWLNEATNVRVANRGKGGPDVRNDLVGFRCAR